MVLTRSQLVKRKREDTESVSSLPEKLVQKKMKNARESRKVTALMKKFAKKGMYVKTEDQIKTENDDEVLGDRGDSETEVGRRMRAEHKAKTFVGAHVSISGGIDKAPGNAKAIGARAFALFLRNQRTWVCKPMANEAAVKFQEACEQHGYGPSVIVPHGSYLLNCGAPNPETLRKSREALVDEVQRCEKLGLTKYNFHPGSTCGQISVDECLVRIAESIDMAHQATKTCTLLLENMSGQGNTVCGKFEELRGIIDRVQDKSRVGVCLDTCHAMAAGYDLSKETGYENMMSDFEKIIGFQYLQAVHLNDSKGEAGCHLDRHENIGRGKIGLAGFNRIMNDPRLENIPMVLETPPELDDDTEIRLLYSLC